MGTKLNATLIALFLGVVAIAGCNSTSTNKENEKVVSDTLDITVSINPQKYFVKKIGGDRISVNVMVPPGAEPHTYEPKPRQLQELSEAEAYITIGVPFEQPWMNRIKSANRDLKIIDSGKGIERIKMVAEHHHDHHHDSKEKEEKEEKIGVDPHIWLAPNLVKIQAKNIYDGLIKLDSANQAEYQKNLDKFLAELEQIDREIEQNLAGITNRKFIVFHPAWGYFAKEYNLQQIPIEVEGTEPSAAELKELIELAKEKNIKVIFVEPQFSKKSAETIAREIGAEVVEIDPLNSNWSKNLKMVSQILARKLSQTESNNTLPIFIVFASKNF